MAWRWLTRIARQRGLRAAEGVGVDCCGAQDGAHLVLDRAAVPRGAQAELFLELVVELANGKRGHENSKVINAKIANDCIEINALKTALSGQFGDARAVLQTMMTASVQATGPCRAN